MRVTLLNVTTDALDLLLFTKQTRLALNPGLLQEIGTWPLERKMKELDYMLGTIQSSWEFVHYTFLIDGVSRAFTHQLVRTRQGSYAQQSQRTVDMEGFDYVIPTELMEERTNWTQDHNLGTTHPDYVGPFTTKDDEFPENEFADVPSKDANPAEIYDWTMCAIDYGYGRLRELGVPPQDARGVLPTNVSTNIIASFSLRTLADMAKLRLCTRTQGEYQDVFREMRKQVIATHDWAEPFLRVHCAALGVCAFPNYMECPIKPPIFNPDTGVRWDGLVHLRPQTREEIQDSWEVTRFEARPAQVKP